jgi:hypothetical protein
LLKIPNNVLRNIICATAGEVLKFVMAPANQKVKGPDLPEAGGAHSTMQNIAQLFKHMFRRFVTLLVVVRCCCCVAVIPLDELVLALSV